MKTKEGIMGRIIKKPQKLLDIEEKSPKEYMGYIETIKETADKLIPKTDGY